MRGKGSNHYERAFSCWLVDSGIRHIGVDETKRTALGRFRIKSFDYLLYPPGGKIIIAEVKGRAFKGKTFKGTRGFECWVPTDDVAGLAQWQQILGAGHRGVFVFAYHIIRIDVDMDGRTAFEFDGRRYIFFGVTVDDYRSFMKIRSLRWQTVTLPAEKFRDCAVEMVSLTR